MTRIRVTALVLSVFLAGVPAAVRAESAEATAKAAAVERDRMVDAMSEAHDALKAEEKRVGDAEEAEKKAKGDAKTKTDDLQRLTDKRQIADRLKEFAADWYEKAGAAYVALGETVGAADELQKAEKAGKGLDEATKKLKEATKKLEEATKKSDKAVQEADAAKLDYRATGSGPQESVGDSLSQHVLLQVGLVTLNPFTIKEETDQQQKQKFTLHSSDATARGFVQISFTHAWAWFSEAQRKTSERQRSSLTVQEEGGYTKMGPQLALLDPSWAAFKDWLQPDDFDVRLGYTFANDKKTGSTVVGSGDLFGDVAFGMNLYRGHLPDDDSVISFNFPQFGAGLVSGRDVLDIHMRGFGGVAFVVGTPVSTDALGSRGRRVLLWWRGGWSTFEVPELVGDTNEVKVEHGFPKFGRVWGGLANEFEFRVPVRETGFLTATGAFYDNADPNPWSFQVGYSLPLDQLDKKLASLVGILN